jgi:uncharacterized protein involved in exopolysaccharide biosynthesis
MPIVNEALELEGAAGHKGRGRPGFPADPYRLRRALRGGKRSLIGIGGAGVIVAFLLVKLIMSSAYQTTAVLQYEGDLHVAGVPTSNNALGPAADALMRQSVLREIANEIGFEGSLRTLQNGIGYEIDLMSRTLQITVLGETGEDAAEVARTVSDVFMAYHKGRQSRRIEVEIARGEKRIEAAETQADVARRRYNEFREEHGIADLSTEQQSMVKSAATLRADSELAVSETRALEAQVKSLEAQLASTPKTSFVSGGISPERATYNRLRQELASARATLSAEHPRVQALQQQVDQLGSQLRSGGNPSSSGGGLVGVNTTYQVVDGQLRDAKSRLAAVRERQKGLAQMADNAQHRIEAFSGIEGEASALLAEVKVNENLVSGLRRTEAALEDALRDPPSGFVVLDPGAVPEYPVRNKAKTVVFGAIVMVSFAFALFIVLRREFGGLRLETPAEVAFWGNGPVLGATSWPNDLQSLDELVAGLDDFVPHARASLLIVGGSPEESQIANELADRMNSDWFPTDARRPAAPSATEAAPAERAPLQTPPPSGPYPIGGSSSHSLALVRRPSVSPSEAIRLTSPAGQLRLEAWDGPYESQALRRAARIADRVVVLVRSCAMSAAKLNGIRRRVGRERGIGYIVVGLPEELHTLPDRVGDVAAFWRS